MATPSRAVEINPKLWGSDTDHIKRGELRVAMKRDIELYLERVLKNPSVENCRLLQLKLEEYKRAFLKGAIWVPDARHA